MMISCEPVEFKDRVTGRLIKKWKYIFIDAEGKKTIAWGATGRFRKDATEKLNYEDSLAKTYPFRLSEWKGNFRETIDDDVADADVGEEEHESK